MINLNHSNKVYLNTSPRLHQTDRLLPVSERFWLKANIWHFIFGFVVQLLFCSPSKPNHITSSFVGNYFWTHYFYTLLGAHYTMDTYRLNNVPYLMFFATQCYFLFYHCIATICLRVLNQLCSTQWKPIRIVFLVIFIATLAYFTAFMETYSIQHFPFYVIINRTRMYLVGSIFYALYFVVSFPMFWR